MSFSLLLEQQQHTHRHTHVQLVWEQAQAARRLERELQKPADFGMAKSFVLMGKEAGFDMEAPEGMQAWVQASHGMRNEMVASEQRNGREEFLMRER